MILYTENLNISTKKLLELTNEFSKFAGYKINIQKFMAFLYTDNELSERKSNPIQNHTRKNKIPRNKLNQGNERPISQKLLNTDEGN